MSFLESALGPFIGFVGALILFFLIEYFNKAKQEKSIVKNLTYELKYNLNLYEKFEEQIQECIEGISNDKRNVYLNLDYDFVGRYFALQFYRQGGISKFFHHEDMRRWNISLTSISEGGEKYVTDSVDKWRDSEIEKSEVFDALNYEKTQIKYAKEMSEYILNKLTES